MAIRMGSPAEGQVLLDYHPLVASIKEVLIGAFDPLLEKFIRPNLFVKANHHEVLVPLEIKKTDQLVGMEVDGGSPIFVSMAFGDVDVHQAI